MADGGDSNPPPPKTSPFLACFGFPGKRSTNSNKIPGKVHRDRRWFRRSTFFFKQSAAGKKTVPLESDKIHFKKNSSMFIKSKLKTKTAGLDSPVIRPQSPAPVKAPQQQTPHKKKSDFKKNTTDENEIIRNDHPSTNESFHRRIDVTRNTSSQSNRVVTPRSTSFPARVSTKKPPKEMTTNNLDPMVGMSIIMVTLVILLIWGRLCAIVCTCTWLYFVPRLRRNPGQTNGLVWKPEPEEYMKKRVVFEGFLERNHKQPLLSVNH